jgi:hypothetical protein
MLMRTADGIYQKTSPLQVVVTGRNIAHGHRTVNERAFLAGDMKRGRVSPIELTIKQCAMLCRVCVPYVAAAVAIADDSDARAAVLAGRLPLLAVAKAGTETLAEHFVRSTPNELLEAARVIGPAVLWDRMISPLV